MPPTPLIFSPGGGESSHNSRENAPLLPHPSPPLAAPSPLVPAPENNAGRVRLNAIRNSITWSNNTNSPRSLVFLTTTLLPQVVAALAVLAQFPAENCTESDTVFSLRMWVQVDALLKCAQLVLMWSPLAVLYVVRAENETILSFLQFKRLFGLVLEVSALVWVVQGSNFFFRNDNSACVHNAPHVLQLGQAMFLISMLFLSFPILICLVFLPVLCCCFPCFVRFLLALRIVNPNSSTIQGASQEVLDDLPQKRYDQSLFQDCDNATCAICLQNYADGDMFRELPCDRRHHFHVACVDDWLKLNATCPVCRKSVLQPDLQQQQQEQLRAGDDMV